MKNRSVVVIDVSSVTNLLPSREYVGGVETDLLTLFVLYCLAKGTWTIPQRVARIILCKNKQRNNHGRKTDGGYRLHQLSKNNYIKCVNAQTIRVGVQAIKSLKQAVENAIRSQIDKGKIPFELIPKEETVDLSDVYGKVWKQYYYRFHQAEEAYIKATDPWKLPWMRDYEMNGEIVKSSVKRA